MIETLQDLEYCVDERKTLEQAETALRETLSKSFSYGAPDDLLDAVDKALVAVDNRLSDIRAVESELYRKLNMAGQFI
jgi:hypothetical protein